ncbi:MAG: arylesterase [Zetaproteobacteria bacterium CG_4_9_14_3_um_filter_53_7]|nr:MAG: arylesterase [Zetaproteobacteria bacterium CG_4_9_14_3_um_filter_53_7]
MRIFWRGSCKRLLLAALLLSFVACSSSPQLPGLSPDAVILAFGDSLTYGSGVSSDQTYPAVLSRLSGHAVVNAGVPGEVTAAGLLRLPGLLDQAQPELMVLCHGGNDMLRKSSLERTKSNIRAMVELARSRGVSVLLLAVPQPGVLMSAPDLYQEVADEMHIPLETDILPDILTRPALKSDRIHPNAQGYRMMAEAVFRQLKESRAL